MKLPMPRVAHLSLLILGLALAISLRAAARREPPRPTPPRASDGLLRFEVRDAATSTLIPCKLTLLGLDHAADPLFTHNDIGRQEGDSILAYNRVLSLSGTGTVRVPAGSYDVWVSRGPEWDVATIRRVKIGPREQHLTAQLRHVLSTDGWISGDFHVHAAPSPDSQVPLVDRVYEFVADGVDLLVATDHNVVTDYAPVIAELGARRLLLSATGDELTTGGWGHFGAFPLPKVLEQPGQGAVLVHGRSAKDFFHDVRENAPDALIDVHHPRIDNEIGYFNLARFDARADHAEKPGFSFDFDAIEVLNGYQDSERRSVDRMIEDWFALLDHGHLVTATGNSDTHHLDHNIGGYPRNYVRVDEDDLERVSVADIARAVKAHRSFFTTAPFVRFTSGKANIGDLARAQSGRASVSIAVEAAPWVTVSTVTLYVDGIEHQRWKVPVGTQRLRFTSEVELSFARDAYAVVRVDGDKPLSPIVGDNRHFDVHPFALTNPIFFDIDGNGRYDAPLRAR